MMTFRIVTLT